MADRQIDINDILTRITIRDILVDAGYNPKGKRMACPIHGGKNRTSFSFSKHVFYCFSCGAKGGIIAFAQYLYGLNKAESIKYLCQLAGLPAENSRSAIRNKYLVLRKSNHSKNKRTLYDNERAKLFDRLHLLGLYESAILARLKILREIVSSGKCALSDYYTNEQTCLQVLEELDAEKMILNYAIHQHFRRADCQKFQVIS